VSDRRRPLVSRSRSGAAAVNCRRDWTAAVTRNTLAALLMATTSYHPSLWRPCRRRQWSPASFCQRSRTGRMRCCRRLRNGTTTWLWTYRHRRRIYHQEVSHVIRSFV